MTSLASRREVRMSRKHKEWLWAYIFIAPTVIGLFAFLIAPIFFSMYISLTKWDNLTEPIFLGLANYARMFTDPVILLEVKNTLVYTLIGVPILVALSVLIAAMLSRKVPALGFFRAAIFIPYVTLPAAAAVVWQNMFNSKFGMINGLLRNMGLPRPDWLSSPTLVFGIIIAIGIWASVGYYVIILLVGIKNLPKSYFEAAKIDGASSTQSFFRITVPLLTPQIFFVLTMATINSFKVFDSILIFGRNDATIRDGIRTMVFGIFERGMTYHEMGYASANAMLLLTIILVITALQFVIQKRWVHYE